MRAGEPAPLGKSRLSPFGSPFTPDDVLQEAGGKLDAQGAPASSPVGVTHGLTINDLGEAVGQIGDRPFLYRGRRLIELGVSIGSFQSGAGLAVNLLGQVVGPVSLNNVITKGFIYSAGRMQVFSGPAGTDTVILGLNNLDQAMKYFYLAPIPTTRSCVGATGPSLIWAHSAQTWAAPQPRPLMTWADGSGYRFTEPTMAGFIATSRRIPEPSFPAAGHAALSIPRVRHAHS